MNRQQAWYDGWAVVRLGGPGSGHHGHTGRPGERGGSQPGAGGRAVPPARGEEGPGHSMGERSPISSWAKRAEGPWESWTVENYRKEFREHTGNYLDDSVPLEKAQDIAAHLEDWPKTGRPATFKVAEERMMVSGMLQEGEVAGLYDEYEQSITLTPRFEHLMAPIVRHEFSHHLDRGTKETPGGKILPTMRSTTWGDPVGDLIVKAHEEFRYPNYEGSSVELLPAAMHSLDQYARSESKLINVGTWKTKYPELYEAIEITVGGKENMPAAWQT